MFGSLKVRVLGDPILRQKAKLVKSVGPVERMLIATMFETMQSHKGIGLAAGNIIGILNSDDFYSWHHKYLYLVR